MTTAHLRQSCTDAIDRIPKTHQGAPNDAGRLSDRSAAPRQAIRQYRFAEDGEPVTGYLAWRRGGRVVCFRRARRHMAERVSRRDGASGRVETAAQPDRSERPLCRSDAISLPPIEAVFRFGSAAIDTYLGAHGWQRDWGFNSNFKGTAAHDYEREWMAQCPLYTGWSPSRAGGTCPTRRRRTGRPRSRPLDVRGIGAVDRGVFRRRPVLGDPADHLASRHPLLLRQLRDMPRQQFLDIDAFFCQQRGDDTVQFAERLLDRFPDRIDDHLRAALDLDVDRVDALRIEASRGAFRESARHRTSLRRG